MYEDHVGVVVDGSVDQGLSCCHAGYNDAYGLAPFHLQAIRGVVLKVLWLKPFVYLFQNGIATYHGYASCFWGIGSARQALCDARGRQGFPKNAPAAHPCGAWAPPSMAPHIFVKPCLPLASDFSARRILV